MHKKIKIQKPKRHREAALGNHIISGLHLEAFSNRRINVDGVLNLCDYNEAYIKLRIKEGYLTVTGKELDVLTFEGQQLTITGLVTSLEFCLKE